MIDAKTMVEKFRSLYKGKTIVISNENWKMSARVADVFAIGEQGAEFFEFVYKKLMLERLRQNEEEPDNEEEDSIIDGLAEAFFRKYFYPEIVVQFTSVWAFNYWSEKRKKHEYLKDIPVI